MKNRICDILGIEKPVVQGPMAWLTDAKLVAAVGNAGGIGTLGPNAGQTTVTRDPVETAERMRREIKKVRELTDKPFAVNLLPNPDGEDIFTPPMLKVVYEEKAPVVVVTSEPDEALFKDLKAHGVKIINRPLNPTPENAKKAEACGADIFVATGFDEGGTLPDTVIGTFSIVPMIVDAVDHIPVMAAGGIADSRTFNAAFALGAEGAFCGTVFLLSEESRIADNIKQDALKANARNLLLFRTMPAYYRSLPGKLSIELLVMDKLGASNEDIGKRMGGLSKMRVGMLEGNMDDGYASFGNSISFVHEVKPVKAIMDAMTANFVE